MKNAGMAATGEEVENGEQEDGGFTKVEYEEEQPNSQEP
jgi:hypothetical protein